MNPIDAIFEHGIFRPLQPVGLDEGTQVEVFVRSAPASVKFADRAVLPDFAKLQPHSGDTTLHISADRDNDNSTTVDCLS